MYNPEVGRFLSQDPLAFTANDPNLHRYVGNSPTNYTDPTGEDRYITHYSSDWNLLGHVGIAVDVWTRINGHWQVTGQVTYDFKVDTWCYVDAIFGSVYYYGKVEKTSGLNLRDPIRFSSNFLEDRAMIKEMEEEIAHPSAYSFIVNNCLTWSISHLQLGMGHDSELDRNMPPIGEILLTGPPPEPPKAPKDPADQK